MEIEQVCIPFQTDCLHWVRTSYEDEPFIMWGSTILKTEEKLPCNRTCTAVVPNSCGNPWNVVDEPTTQKLKEICPKARRAIPTKTRHNMRMINSADTLKQELEDIVGADCWAVYTRDSTKKPVQCYFNHRHSSWFTENARDQLIKDASPLVRDVDQGLELVIVMGSTPFIDIYIQKLGGMYVVAEVHYRFIKKP